jgi:hypothetical protein
MCSQYPNVRESNAFWACYVKVLGRDEQSEHRLDFGIFLLYQGAGQGSLAVQVIR